MTSILDISEPIYRYRYLQIIPILPIISPALLLEVVNNLFKSTATKRFPLKLEDFPSVCWNYDKLMLTIPSLYLTLYLTLPKDLNRRAQVHNVVELRYRKNKILLRQAFFDLPFFELAFLKMEDIILTWISNASNFITESLSTIFRLLLELHKLYLCPQEMKKPWSTSDHKS